MAATSAFLYMAADSLWRLGLDQIPARGYIRLWLSYAPLPLALVLPAGAWLGVPTWSWRLDWWLFLALFICAAVHVVKGRVVPFLAARQRKVEAGEPLGDGDFELAVRLTGKKRFERELRQVVAAEKTAAGPATSAGPALPTGDGNEAQRRNSLVVAGSSRSELSVIARLTTPLTLLTLFVAGGVMVPLFRATRSAAARFALRLLVFPCLHGLGGALLRQGASRASGPLALQYTKEWRMHSLAFAYDAYYTLLGRVRCLLAASSSAPRPLTFSPPPPPVHAHQRGRLGAQHARRRHRRRPGGGAPRVALVAGPDGAPLARRPHAAVGGADAAAAARVGDRHRRRHHPRGESAVRPRFLATAR